MDANFREDNQGFLHPTLYFDGLPLKIENVTIQWFRHSGSFFEFHEAFDNEHGRNLFIGFGKHKMNNLGLRNDSVEFAQLCQEEYELLKEIYPTEQFPFLLPKQIIFMGNDYSGRKQTVVCVRKKIDIVKRIHSFVPDDLIQFPNLNEELINFHQATKDGLRRLKRICDIKQTNNLIIDPSGHLVLLDTNNVFYEHEESAGFRMARRRLRAIARITHGDISFSRAYEEQCRLEVLGR